jgi:Tol biopolymer transport system component
MTRRTTLVLTVGLAVVLLWLLAGCRVADQRHNTEDLDSGLRASSAGNCSSGGDQHTEISNGKIAFMRTTRVDFVNSSPSSAAPASGPSGLYVMKPDGTGLKKLSKEMPYAQAPLWSPEGKEIAFSGAGVNKYIVNADGKELRELMPNVRDHVASYSWSPDGEKIAFAAVHYRGELDVYEIDADGTGQTNLTSTKTIIEDEPSWSPDGKHIAFTRADAGDVYVDQDVYLMNADGTGRTRLANNASSPSFAPGDRS